jgi:hypothetical protein
MSITFVSIYNTDGVEFYQSLRLVVLGKRYTRNLNCGVLGYDSVQLLGLVLIVCICRFRFTGSPLAIFCASVHENQLIKDLFTQTLEERRLKRIWPKDFLDEV